MKLDFMYSKATWMVLSQDYHKCCMSLSSTLNLTVLSNWKVTPCEDKELTLYTEVWLTTFESWKTAPGPPCLGDQAFLLLGAATWGTRKLENRRDLHLPETSSARLLLPSTFS